MPKSHRRIDITPAQCRAARAFLGITQPELAALSELSRDVIVRLERGAPGLHYTTPGKVEAALAARGVTLVRDDMGSGVRLARESPLSREDLAAEIMTPTQCRAARALLDLNSRRLAKLAGVDQDVVRQAERTGVVTGAVLKRVRATLVVAGIFFQNDQQFLSVQAKLARTDLGVKHRAV
jgi:DNA-binding XRE family transcriptional regulator